MILLHEQVALMHVHSHGSFQIRFTEHLTCSNAANGHINGAVTAARRTRRLPSPRRTVASAIAIGGNRCAEVPRSCATALISILRRTDDSGASYVMLPPSVQCSILPFAHEPSLRAKRCESGAKA